MKSVEAIFTFFLMVASIFFFIGSLEFSMFTSFGGVGAGLIPAALSILLFILASINLFILLRKGKENQNKFFNKESLKNQIYLGLIIIGCLLLTNVVGMLIGMFILVLLNLRFIEHMKWSTSFFFSIGFIVSIFILFETLLGVSFPRGMIF